MKTIILFLLLMPFCFVAEGGDEVRRASVSLFGEKVGTVAKLNVSASITNSCPGATFYAASMIVPPDELEVIPNTNPPKPFAICLNSQLFSLVSAENIGSFLSSFEKPVENEKSAYNRVEVFAELIGGSVRTNMPERQSLISGYAKLNPKDWPVVIEGTKRGWNISFSLMMDADIEYCVRYTLRIDKDGKTIVPTKVKTIYTYTLYE